MHTDLLSLNYDVLAHVLAHLDPRDARQLALTCRPLHDAAYPRVLASVTLGGLFHSARPAVHQLTAFCASMLARPAQLAHLHRLEVRRDAVRRRTHGTWAVDSACVRALANVLAAAPSLASLTLWGADALFAACPAIIPALASSPALADVTLGGVVPPLPALARAFPHARALHFVDTCAPWDASLATDETNISMVTPESGGWKQLDRLEARHAVLPLACPVRRVDLRDPLTAQAEEHARAALAFVRNINPVVLSVALDAGLPADAFVDGLRDVGSLRFVDVELWGCEREEDARAWMIDIARALAPLPLRALALRRHAPPTSPRGTPRSTPLPSRAPSPTSELPAAADSLDALARAIAREVPELQFLAVQPGLPSSPSSPSALDGSAVHQEEEAWYEVIAEGRGVREYGTAREVEARVERMHVDELARVRGWVAGLGRFD